MAAVPETRMVFGWDCHDCGANNVTEYGAHACKECGARHAVRPGTHVWPPSIVAVERTEAPA